jgi:small subunit ribosomal protein S20
MANIKSAQKSIRKIATRTVHNRSIRSRLRTLSKNVDAATEGEGKTVAARQYVAALDKAAKTGIIHTNNANRKKARVAKYVFAS